MKCRYWLALFLFFAVESVSAQALNAFLLQWRAVSCNNDGGKVSVQAYGGGGGYTYLWSTGAVADTVYNLSAGEVSVTIYSGVDSMVRSITLAPFGPDTVVFRPACYGINDGSIFIDNFSGQYPLQYVWYKNDTLLAATTSYIDSLTPATYRYYVTDGGGCVDSGTLEIKTSSPVIQAYLSDSSLCYQQQALVWFTPGFTMPDGGGNFYNSTTDTFFYNNIQGNLNQIPTGGYDSIGCWAETTLPMVYTQGHPYPDPLYLRHDTVMVYWGNPSLSYPGYRYRWSSGGVTVLDSTLSYLIVDTAGQYSCTVYNEYDCPYTSFIWVTTVGFQEFEVFGLQFTVYPNPASGNLNISVPENLIGEEISVFDLSGRKILSEKAVQSNVYCLTSKISSGIYFVKIGNLAKKFVKQ